MSRILNFGSLNIDRSYDVEHIVQPGETLSSVGLVTCSGGKGLNQSIALACAGARVSHAGRVGNDGKMLTELLESYGVDVSQVRVDAEVPTGHAIIQIDKTGQNCIILFPGANGRVTSADAEETLSAFGAGDVLLLQNEISRLKEIIALAAEKGMFIVLNPSPISETLFHCGLEKVGMLVMNEIEGAALSGETEPEKILDRLLEAWPEIKLVLTLGGDGAWYADRSRRCFQEAIACPVVDTTAAGDTFTGYFLSEYLSHGEAEKALLTAARAASIAIGRRGAAPSIPRRRELEELFG